MAPTTRRCWQLSLIAALFGMGSWIAITGLWLEMPLLIARLPEGWRLPSQLNIAVQLANIGPLLYWAALKLHLADDITGTHVQLMIGVGSCAVLIFAWDMTITFGGAAHSVVLLICTFGLALVDCTSSVTFLTFMARFDSVYMTPYLVGEGLSGLIPSAVAFLQGVGEDHQDCTTKASLNATQRAALPQFKPRFSVDLFFVSLFITIIISYVAFCLLQLLPYFRKQMLCVTSDCHQESNNNNKATSSSMLGINLAEMRKVEVNGNDLPDDEEMVRSSNAKTNHRQTYYCLLALMCWNCFTTFGFFPSVQPYSALPYGTQTMHHVVILSGLAYPAGCFLGMLYELRCPKIIYLLTALGTLFGAYIVVCALLSPLPPLVTTPFGGPLIITSWIAFTFILSYAKTMATVWICEYNAQAGMFWVGMSTQFGAAAGALLNFVLVNSVSGLFNEC